MDVLGLLRLQIEWGADEALDDAPVNRMAERVAAIRAPATPRPLAAPPMLPAGTPVARAQAAAGAAMTIDQLRETLAAFDGCGLSATATSLVFADGDPQSRLMVVGDVPGAEEDRAGKPFIGPAGQLWDKMMGSIGLDRSQVLITNVIPWRPPGNRTPTETEVAICLPFLLRHISLVQPRRLVLLGGLATHAVMGTKGGMARLRGKWVKAGIPGLETPIATLPMLHPAYIASHPDARRDAWRDLITLRRDIESEVQ